ncbi:hypothetical protein MKZ38_007401 [Zalerion maritima]|uniref:Phosphatidate phosphatase APP1 catalytic domain-containing protein n=1 Tax=Zalerion maritima TaxID=339359 RepID=A0AAD5RI25_9PEZI|nr:hypothetical protein MKZ38_007401 [Zalerion maritima]
MDAPNSVFLQLLSSTTWRDGFLMIAIAAAASFLIQTLYQWNKLRHIKGPFLAGLTKFWLLPKVTGPNQNLEYWKVCQQYGKIARIGPDDVIISDPAHWRRMLSKGSGYVRSDWYDGMRFDVSRDNLLSMVDDRVHNRVRRKLVPGYSGKDVDDVEPKIMTNVERLVHLIESKYITTRDSYKPMDLARKASFFTMDVISDIAFDTPYGFLDKDSDIKKYLEESEAIIPSLVITAVFPWMARALRSPIFKPLMPTPEDDKGFGVLMGLTHKVVNERWSPSAKGSEKRDMVESFKKNGLTADEAVSELGLTIIAGSDTTATAMRATLLHIITNPRVLSGLADEIKTFQPSSPITDAEAKNMPYLQAVIQEGLRMFPPIASLQSKWVPPEGDWYEGIYLPPGTKVGASFWAMMRDTSIWGDDAMMFRPERWLEVEDVEREKMELELGVLFGVGRWQCLGKTIALMELNKVFVELAPPPFNRSGRPHYFTSLLRYLLPRAVRESYRERVLSFHLDVLPRYKYSAQSRIHRFLVNRHVRRKEQTRILDIVRRSSRRLLLGPPKPPFKNARHEHHHITPKKMSVPGYGYGGSAAGGYGSDSSTRERGARRRKLAAMAGSLYNAGKAAATEIKETYNQGLSRGIDMSEGHHTNIPGAFPDVSIVVEGDEQMVLFPSYAKNHIREHKENRPEPDVMGGTGSFNDRDYWQEEWRRTQDENAVVDVDVRGWVYSPHKGPMTRRNRLLIGAARQLSSIPPPRAPATGPTSYVAAPEEASTTYESRGEQERIAREAARIERIGQGEKDAATRGDYSENPAICREEEPEFESHRNARARSGSQTPGSVPGSPILGPTRVSSIGNEFDDAELALANVNMMSRLGPFLTTPLVRIPMTMFFYNEQQSQSRTVETNDAGHFSVRASLAFVPTHVRVIANETLSSIQPIHIIDSTGVSLISDIDDTIKKSNISLGAKEIFRNTFARDLSSLTIPGVADWYNRLCSMGVHMHYCSNSPWQLFPVLATFFKLASLPDGSIHLKHYPGLLQGIFEPVAERKKPTLERILSDFPQRKFILVGDSGEADLEVYTDIALANPNRILAIFIRDVTTPEQPGFFDAAYDQNFMRRGTSSTARSKQGDLLAESAPVLPPRPVGASGHTPQKPATGNLIDFSDEPDQITPPPIPDDTKHGGAQDGKKGPPPRPAKPVALRSAPSGLAADPVGSQQSGSRGPPAPPPPRSRKPLAPHPLTQTHNARQMPSGSSGSSSASITKIVPPPPPPPRRRGTPSSVLSASPRSMAHGRAASNSDVESLDLPPASAPVPNTVRVNSGFNGNEGAGADQYNKKLVMWRTRLERAHEQLNVAGVKLYTWRRGEDVLKEAEGLVKDALRDMGLWR